MGKEKEKILFCGDESAMSAPLFLLKSLGYGVKICPQGSGALSELERSPFGLVLIAPDLPDMEANELVMSIKGKDGFSDLPVVVIADFSEDEELKIAACIKAGADDFIPVALMETLTASSIASNLERKRLREKEKEYLEIIRQEKKVIEEKNRELTELNMLKNKFLGMAAHDIRNPLGSISGFTGLLIDEDLGELNADQKEYLAIIKDNADFMLSLVNDLLDVSVIESGKLGLKPDTHDLAELVRERAHIFQGQAGKKGISIQTRLPETAKARIDRYRIAQVLDNLISNAIKFSPPETAVTVTLEKENGVSTVSVADMGPGLNEEDREKLFGEFKTLSARPTGGEKSTGLGLSIAKKIVDAHGGTISAEGKPGTGSLFFFSLPG